MFDGGLTVRIVTSLFSLGLTVWTLIDTLWIYKHRHNGLKKWTVPLIILFALNTVFFVFSIADQWLAFYGLACGFGTLISVMQRSISALILFMYNHAKKLLMKVAK